MTTALLVRLAALALATVLALTAARCGRDIDLGVAPPVDASADAGDAGADAADAGAGS
jgi:hypothetical protein